ncbi:hypothetical protein FQN52_008002 [Onygenales sp. PD_12]|nr:hypothetical protein FQN52_008002 [Onygenales sp. PD_12]
MADTQDIEKAIEAGESKGMATETIMIPPNASDDSLPGSENASPSSGAPRYGLSSYRFRRVASKTIVSFHSQDPENPINWSKNKKRFIVLSGMVTVLNSTLCASLPSGAIPFMSKEFNITSDEQLVLPISMFLAGYVVGPIICGPLSESYGRKVVMVVPFFVFMLFTLACALCQSWASFLVFRVILGIVASAPISIVGGLFADIYDEPRERGQVMTSFMAATTCGPLVGPFLSGFTAVINWRWPFWIGLIFAGITAPLCVFMPETYAPVLLQRRARALRKETGNNSIVAPFDIQKKGLKVIFTVTLTRPVRMVMHESIVSFTCIYHMNNGVSGLMYLPIAVGAFAAWPVFTWWDTYHYKSKERGASWADIEEYRRLPLACIGGPLYVIALLWLGWTASPNIHWAAPMLSGIPFGAGFMLIFIAMLNYLADAYETFASSANSAASCCRSIFAVLLPIATTPMFNRLGVSWSCTMLACFSLAMSLVPFAFIRYGGHIRSNSKFCQYLRELKEAERRLEEEEDRELELRGRLGKETDVEKGQVTGPPIP